MDDYFLAKPEQIKLSLTNICNYRCVMCYNPKLKQERGFMSDELFYKILEECQREEIQKISLGSTGEALLHKNYLDFLRFAKKSNFWTSTTSNCSRLTPKMSDAIVNENLLNRFNISIYSANTEEHKKYTGSDCFDQVCENIKYFLKVWGKSDQHIQVNMWFLQLPDINNYKEYKKLWQPITAQVGLELPLKQPINWGGLSGIIDKKKENKRFSIEQRQGQRFLKWKKRVRCHHIRYYMYILHDGTAVPCCNIPDPGNNKEINFGNIDDDTIMSVWKSDRYIQFKKALYNHKIATYSPCRCCSELEEESQIQLSLDNLPARCMNLLKSL